MSAPQRNVAVSSWIEPDRRAAEFTVWPTSQRADTELDRALRGRLSLAIELASASVQLRPTIAEATALIEALEWAVAQSEAQA